MIATRVRAQREAANDDSTNKQNAIGDAFTLARDIGFLATSTIARKVRGLEKRIDAILATRTDCVETNSALRKVANARDQLLIGATAPPGLVDPTNNACERALRPSVIGRKITNGFRAEWAADVDASVRSVVDTPKLAGSEPFHSSTQTLRP